MIQLNRARTDAILTPHLIRYAPVVFLAVPSANHPCHSETLAARANYKGAPNLYTSVPLDSLAAADGIAFTAIIFKI